MPRTAFTLDPLVGTRRPRATKITGHWPGREMRRGERTTEGFQVTTSCWRQHVQGSGASHPSFWAAHGMSHALQQGASGPSPAFPNWSWCEMQAPACSRLQIPAFSDFYFSLSLLSLEPGLKGSYSASPNPLGESCQPTSPCEVCMWLSTSRVLAGRLCSPTNPLLEGCPSPQGHCCLTLGIAMVWKFLPTLQIKSKL